MKRSTTLLTALFVVLLAGNSPLFAATLYGIGRDDFLYRIDENTGQGTIVGSLGIDIDSVGADVSPDGRLFGAGQQHGTGSDFLLFTVNLTTGAATVVQTFDTSGLNRGLTGIAFAPDGRLFWRNAEFLHLLDIDSGNFETVATFSSIANSLTRTPDGQAFYSSGSFGLTRIELSDFSETIIGDFFGPSLALSPDGTLYGSSVDPDGLYIVDQTTAESTLVGPIGHDTQGMAFVIPEPTTLTLIALALLGLLVHGHRRIILVLVR